MRTIEQERERRRLAEVARRARKGEEIRRRDRERYAADPSRKKGAVLRYIAKNPEKKRLWGKVSDHRKRAPGDLSAADISLIMSLPCAYCGGPAEMLEHCEPIARGGWNCAENCVSACTECNLKKSDSTVLEFLGLWPGEVPF